MFEIIGYILIGLTVLGTIAITTVFIVMVIQDIIEAVRS